MRQLQSGALAPTKARPGHHPRRLCDRGIQILRELSEDMEPPGVFSRLLVWLSRYQKGNVAFWQLRPKTFWTRLGDRLEGCFITSCFSAHEDRLPAVSL
jgi:hypothetical protein